MVKVLKNSRGFTLLEVLLASFLISFGLMCGFSISSNSLQASVNNDLGVVAYNLATEKVESILADNQFYGFEYVIDSSNYPTEDLSGDFSGFTRSVSIIEVSEDDLTTPDVGSGISRVEVTINWGTEAYQQVKVSTLVAEASLLAALDE